MSRRRAGTGLAGGGRRLLGVLFGLALVGRGVEALLLRLGGVGVGLEARLVLGLAVHLRQLGALAQQVGLVRPGVGVLLVLLDGPVDEVEAAVNALHRPVEVVGVLGLHVLDDDPL